MDDFNNQHQYHYGPFEDLDSLLGFPPSNYIFPSGSDPTSPPSFTQAISPVPHETPLIWEHEIRRCFEQQDTWSPFTSSPTSLPSFSSSSSLEPIDHQLSLSPFTVDSPGSSSQFPLPPSPLHPQLFPPFETMSPYDDLPGLLISPATTVSPSFDYASPSASSPEATVTDSPRYSRKRRLSECEDFEYDEQEDSKRPLTEVGPPDPENVAFQTVPQPATSASPGTATKTRLPKRSARHDLCRCTFPKGNKKPARHWETACPFNPNRNRAKHPCKLCSQDFGRKDNLLRHVRKFHPEADSE